MFIVTNPSVAIVKTKTKLSYRRKDIHKKEIAERNDENKNENS